MADRVKLPSFSTFFSEEELEEEELLELLELLELEDEEKLLEELLDELPEGSSIGGRFPNTNASASRPTSNTDSAATAIFSLCCVRRRLLLCCAIGCSFYRAFR